MKNWLFLFLLLLVTSCVDEELVNKGSGDSIQLNLYVPASTTVSTRAMSEKDESAIKDLYVLVFDENDNCILVKKTDVTETEDNAKKQTSLILDKSSDNRSIVALANLEANSLTIDPDSWKNKNKTTILKSLVYTFSGNWNSGTGTSEAWTPFPMWGEFEGTIGSSITINMLRALAKVNVIVNEDKETGEGRKLENFTLNEVRVYYSYTDGYCTPDEGAVTGTGANTKVDKPSIHSYNQMTDKFGKFGVASDERLAFKNNIYLPEADNHKDGQKNVCLLIGGYYDGSEEMSYYRAAFKNTEEGVLDILRNHLYKFNITSVTGPGSKDPDEALKKVDVNMKLDVTVWDETEMRDPSTVQYTLAVNNSTVYIDAKNHESDITVTTSDNTNYWEAKVVEGDWFDVKRNNNKVIISISGTGDYKGVRREGTFEVVSNIGKDGSTGTFKKKIKVIQSGQETANCYIVGKIVDGEGYPIKRDLVVTVKGNGKDGLHADGKEGEHEFIHDTSADLATSKVGIIWETVEGLITIENDTPNEFGCIQYSVDNNKVKNNGKGIPGGNALIGAYGADGKTIIWSWHIWIVPDYANYEGNFENMELEKWVTGYSFMDRNLGAISNKPGYGSLGLLYQWGRKDPLRGVGDIQEATPDIFHMHNIPESALKYEWKLAGGKDIQTSIQNPTQILSEGLLMNSGTDGEFLWGTNQGLVPSSVGVTNVGNKTIYDPCPAGYRVPPVDAYVFGTVSVYNNSIRGDNSYLKNWAGNNVFWPNNNYSYVKPENTDSYGFWIRYDKSGSGSNDKPSVPFYKWGSQQNSPVSVTSSTWFPIAGVYDGTFEKFATVGKNSSVTVNSIVWTNSPISVGGENRPAALFLHGIEEVSSTGNAYNGMHLHNLNETNYGLMAKTQHAGSVRCVRDKAKDYSSQNSVTESVTLGAHKGDVAYGTLSTVNDRWEVINPGAKWFYVTPEEGTGANELNKELKFIVSEDNTGDKRFADMVIRFYHENGSVDRTTRVYQESSKQRFEASKTAISLNRNNGSFEDVRVTTDGQNWYVGGITYIGSESDWLKVEQKNNYWGSFASISATSRNNGSTARKATVLLKDENGSTITITVTQNK